MSSSLLLSLLSLLSWFSRNFTDSLSLTPAVPPPKPVVVEQNTGWKKEDGAKDETGAEVSVLMADAQPDEIIFVVRPSENPAVRQESRSKTRLTVKRSHHQHDVAMME